MRAAALSPPRPSPRPAAACCQGKVGNKFCFTAVIVLSQNHAVQLYTSPARTHTHTSRPCPCVAPSTITPRSRFEKRPRLRAAKTAHPTVPHTRT
eukprot:COSAG04_NODE_26381_length_295_cov_1.040816_1_plen_94_part_10